MLRDKIVFAQQDNRILEALMKEQDLTLEKAIKICRTHETTKKTAKEMSREDN